MKFSQGNKHGNKFKLKLSYIKYIICQAPNCHNSYYIKKKKAKSKAQYFATRKAEGSKSINKIFKAYLAYANQTG
tara:strand:- start:3825 stop:4049 length:225 start_codon:yes stop_codon:yes gene_type:complete